MERLNALRQRCTERKIPIISTATEAFLQQIIQTYKPKLWVEIWGAVWYSSIYVGGLLNTWGGKVISFEVSYPAYQEGVQNSKDAHCYNITSYPYDVLQTPIKKLVPGTADVIFIDGQKNQYGDYMEIVEKISSPHTVIVIDDVIKYHNKLSTLYGYLQKKQINYKVMQLEPDDGIMIING